VTERLALPEREFLSRQEKTARLLQQKELDGLIAFSSYAEREGHVCYLTNHHNSFPNVLSHAGLGHSAFVLPAEGKGVLVSPLGYETTKVVGIDYGKSGWDLIAGVVSATKEKRLDEGRIGIVGSDVIPAEYYKALIKALPKTTFEDANDLLESQRITKSQAEIGLLRDAARMADIGLQAGLEAVREGVREREIELAIREAALNAGVDFIPRIRVSTGPKIASLQWPMVGDRALERGDLVYLDFIGWYGNYGFDNSRVAVVGKASAEQKDYLDHLVEATEWMLDLLRPGREWEFVYTESRGRSITPLAHGIGLEICEQPWITMGKRFTLEPDMVLCVEPIVNSPRFGSMAIEETVVVTQTGVEVLNQCPRRFW
jgi:Xaa-Pro aminopeptidase